MAGSQVRSSERPFFASKKVWSGKAPRLIWRAHFGAPRPRTESMRSAWAGQMRTGPTGTPKRRAYVAFRFAHFCDRSLSRGKKLS